MLAVSASPGRKLSSAPPIDLQVSSRDAGPLLLVCLGVGPHNYSVTAEPIVARFGRHLIMIHNAVSACARALRRALVPAAELLAFVLMTAGVCGSVAIFF
ncbi:hypothetical protein [Methylobacterium radiotolerans]|uniref:hypothetical protein n=1 Tax=Methylobacterium radiotolerans TaxID=31998 RepID=UPI0005DC641F|nr:hypothetical protein [Methylobacterium radiotolerans]GAN49686.1 MFS family transporter [Methylobacterium sp. ME121]